MVARNEMMLVKLGIHTIEGLSGHADRRELMNFIRRASPRPKRVDN
jgi:predicted metal-dependent RNase